MKPIDFPERTNMVAKDQKEYITLPSYIDPGPEGQVIFCTQATFIERLIILFTGKVWVSLMCFGKPVTPSLLAARKTEVLNMNKRNTLTRYLLIGFTVLLFVALIYIIFAKVSALFILSGLSIAFGLIVSGIAIKKHVSVSEFFDRVIENDVLFYIAVKGLAYVGIIIYLLRIFKIL